MSYFGTTFLRLRPGIRAFSISLLNLFTCLTAFAQITTLPLQSAGHQIMDRLSIRNGAYSPIHPEVQPYTRRDAVVLALQIQAKDTTLSKADRRDLQYLLDENSEWLSDCDSAETYIRRNRKSLFGLFYRTPANFFEVNTPAFHVRVNPMLNLSAGKEQNDAELIFANQRGLEVRGDVDGRVFFYTNLLESQVRYPDYVNQWISEFQAVPGAGFYKSYQSKLFNIRNGYDFNLANAYIGGQVTKHIGVQFGHGRHFIGSGYRSLLLSDVGNNTFYLKLSTRIWRLHYQSLFLELNPISTAIPRPANSVLPKKYAAVHYLSLRLTPNLAFGFFEATVFNRSRQFEFQYLNPVILYRTVEGMIGSPDNVLIGFDGRWDLLRRFRLYGQVMIDEFLYSALYKPEEKGWWGNKFGWQAGLKYINAFGVDHLDLQAEYNSVRPFTYSSFDSLNSYSHYNQPLAHPRWANFKEIVLLATYQPLPRLTLSGRVLWSESGDNPAGENYGANPLLSNESRIQDFGNFTGQGLTATTVLAGLDISWQLYHNMYADAKVLFRRKDSTADIRDLETRLFVFGIRMNMWNRNFDF
jgi:hypothetical protein